ncbi:hypothetical protein DEO72_LG11g1213 [Vigna unguiculata]|uniref:Uncharacterized protein n=1 Tax=Vigna unguiculata TaxID=3917 RepID=A0A4D6NNI4_VIGUN|nr:hypothetical protein DEO72_LG11g1213 [Vigna unguiculata]
MTLLRQRLAHGADAEMVVMVRYCNVNEEAARVKIWSREEEDGASQMQMRCWCCFCSGLQVQIYEREGCCRRCCDVAHEGVVLFRCGFVVLRMIELLLRCCWRLAVVENDADLQWRRRGMMLIVVRLEFAATAAATGGAGAPGGGNMVKMEARSSGCVEMKMLTWQHVISSNSLVEIKPTWHVLVGQF